MRSVGVSEDCASRREIVHTEHVDGEVVDVDGLAFRLGSPLNDDGAIIVILLERDRLAIYLVDLEGVLDCELVEFTRTTVENENSLILELLPSENFTSRVENSMLADGIIGDMNLGITTRQGELTAVLGDVQNAIGSGQLDGILSSIGGLVIRMAHDKEVAVLALGSEHRRDGDGCIVAVLGGGGWSWASDEVTWRDAHELGLELDFGVFFAVNVAVFTDGLEMLVVNERRVERETYGSVVVGGVAVGVTEVTPVGSAEDLDC